jgi:hypothetical protein
VVHRHDRRRLGVLGQHALQPGQALGAEGALLVSDDGRVAGHQAQLAHAQRVLNGLAGLPGSAEVGPQAVGVVVVAGQHVHGQPKRRQQLGYAPVLGVAAVVGQIAAQQQRVGRGVQLGDRADGGAKRLRRPQVAGADADVGVADLSQDHLRARVSWRSSAPRRSSHSPPTSAIHAIASDIGAGVDR